MALTDEMIEKTLRNRLGKDVFESSLSNEWWIQEEDKGWDLSVYVNGEKFSEKFGGTPDEVETVRTDMASWLEEDYPNEEDASYFVFDIYFDEEDEPRYG